MNHHHSRLTIHDSRFTFSFRSEALFKSRSYSVRRLFTGFINAAFKLCHPIVMNATIAVSPIAHIKVSAPICMRYLKSCSHEFISHHATGAATANAARIRIENSLPKIHSISPTLLPNTFRIHISFVFCAAINDTNPYKPIQPIKMAIKENARTSFSIVSSVS